MNNVNKFIWYYIFLGNKCIHGFQMLKGKIIKQIRKKGTKKHEL